MLIRVWVNNPVRAVQIETTGEVNDRVPMFSVCENSFCPNEGLIASDPRSSTPSICGVCGDEVLIFTERLKPLGLDEWPSR